MTENKTRTTQAEIDSMYAEIADAKTPVAALREHAKKTKTLIVNLIFVLIAALLLGLMSVIIYAKRNGDTPNVFGYYIYNIETPSMDPTLPVGSLILSKRPKNPENLKKGDVVTFIMLSGDRVTHRIYSVQTDDNGDICYQTKGDNPANSVDYEILTPDRIEAVMLLKIALF